MTQTRVMSFVESWLNVLVGFSINFLANLTILPWFGFAIKPSQAVGMGLIFTGISVGRSYVIRRWFNGLGYTPPCPAPAPASPSPEASTETPRGTRSK